MIKNHLNRLGILLAGRSTLEVDEIRNPVDVEELQRKDRQPAADECRVA